MRAVLFIDVLQNIVLSGQTLIWLTLVKRIKLSCSTFLPAVLVVDKFQGIQRGGTDVTTIDHSDIRGLVTA